MPTEYDKLIDGWLVGSLDALGWARVVGAWPVGWLVGWLAGGLFGQPVAFPRGLLSCASKLCD